MDWYHILRRGYHALPESGLKRFLVGVVYKTLHRAFISSYHYNKKEKLWEIVTSDGIRLLSRKDFDPAPLSDREISSLSPGQNVLDLGGNIGMVAIYMAKKVGPDGHIWVYEPDRKNQQLLKEHIAINEITNITVVPYGVWNQSGTLTFYEGGTYTSSFVKTNYIDEKPSHYQAVSIPVVTLDEEMERFGWKKLDFIKMDIEGSEVAALQGAKNLLSKLSPSLLIETHSAEGKTTAEEVKRFLLDLGYTLEEKARETYPTIIAYKSFSRRQP
ncbi:FkbM family methyltransferase [Thermospira aquatica]|uniref:FkbM family methyltransferase n=1 Tax=Thermospira aquatica TaxID=2828656 RepID=A0AAX3BEZ3_9SPIR|nr:FkbM family methyltransferase [Thermospira aquatica]URA10918.1 FkbM family methyltransferase [Thermospira aquatica]